MMRWITILFFSITSLLVVGGCAGPEGPPVVRHEDVMLFMDSSLHPENLLFPEYLLLEGYELDAHGRIPNSSLIGVGLKANLALRTVLQQYNKLLSVQKWEVTKMEMAGKSFRILAEKKGENVEIRAVQGTGVTQVFILYTPAEVEL